MRLFATYRESGIDVGRGKRGTKRLGTITLCHLRESLIAQSWLSREAAIPCIRPRHPLNLTSWTVMRSCYVPVPAA